MTGVHKQLSTTVMTLSLLAILEIPLRSAISLSGLKDLDFNFGAGNHPFYGKTKQVQYYNSALTDSELEQLTSWTSFSDMAEGQLYTIE